MQLNFWSRHLPHPVVNVVLGCAIGFVAVAFLVDLDDTNTSGFHNPVAAKWCFAQQTNKKKPQPSEQKKPKPLSKSSVKPKPSKAPAEPPLDDKTNSTPESRGGFEGTKAGERTELAGIAFRWCPAGEFKMGSTSPFSNYNERQVEVTLAKGFWVGETEITQRQWKQLMGTSPWSGQEFVKEGDDFAASYLSFDDATAFCQKLTQEERGAGRLPMGWKFTLPTEAQWEYACRAGTKTIFSYGDREDQMKDYGWSVENTLDIGEKYPHQVGLKKPNPWGLKDMHGNLLEWCTNWKADLQTNLDIRTAEGPASGTARVIRGGGWYSGPEACYSYSNSSASPSSRNFAVGFRLVAVQE